MVTRTSGTLPEPRPSTTLAGTSIPAAVLPAPGSWCETSCLLHVRDLLQGGDPLLDRRVRVEQVVEEGAVMLLRVVDTHRRDRVIEVLHRLLIGRDLLQGTEQTRRVARQLHPTRVSQRLALT